MFAAGTYLADCIRCDYQPRVVVVDQRFSLPIQASDLYLPKNISVSASLVLLNSFTFPLRKTQAKLTTNQRILSPQHALQPLPPQHLPHIRFSIKPLCVQFAFLDPDFFRATACIDAVRVDGSRVSEIIIVAEGGAVGAAGRKRGGGGMRGGWGCDGEAGRGNG